MKRKRSIEHLLALGVIPVVVGLLVLQAVEALDFAERQIGVFIEESGDRLVVSDVIPGYPAAEGGILPGDDIVASNGRAVDDTADLDDAMESRSDEGTLTFVVERNGEREELRVEPGAPFPAFSFSVTALTVLCYLVIGPLAIFKRPGYLRAQLLFFLTAAVAIELALPGSHWFLYPWLAVGFLLNGLQMGFELHLASVIPERQDWLDRIPWAIPAYYVVGLAATGFVAAALLMEHVDRSPLPWPAFDLVSAFGTVVPAVWALGVLGLLGRQALTYPEPAGRQQAAIVALGVLPWAIMQVASSSDTVWSVVPVHWEDVVWNVGLLCYPLAVLIILWREASDQERILLDLTDAVGRVTSIPEISRIVSTDLHAAFHPKCTHVFYRRRHSRDLTLGHSTVDHLEEEIIPEDSALLALVGQLGRAVDSPDELEGLPPRETEWLDRLEAKLLVPLRGQDRRLLGLLVLGEKKSEEPYTVRDRKLLQALAGQIALVYENARLKERVDRSQKIQREVLTRLGDEELELVKECPECHRCFDASEVRCPDDGAGLDPSLPVERVVSGRYRLDRRIDRGGMGAIYEGRDLHLDRPVAVKVLLGSFVTDEVVQRFDKEARLTARLRHPNIVTVHDYGTTDTGAPFLVLELLRGTTLAVEIASRSPIPPRRVARWIDAVCAGVSEAHRAEIVHRDLKPANVFIARDEADREVVKLLDFGVAKVRSAVMDATEGLTTPGSLVGTFRYMAPEQLAGGEADERSDLFAIGVLTAEALSGRHPFGGESPTEILRTIEETGPRFSLPPEIAQPRLEAILKRSLATVPDERFQTVAALRAELVPVLEEIGRADGTRGEP